MSWCVVCVALCVVYVGFVSDDSVGSCRGSRCCSCVGGMGGTVSSELGCNGIYGSTMLYWGMVSAEFVCSGGCGIRSLCGHCV